MLMFGNVMGDQAGVFEDEAASGPHPWPVLLPEGRKGAGPRPRLLVLRGDGAEAEAGSICVAMGFVAAAVAQT